MASLVAAAAPRRGTTGWLSARWSARRVLRGPVAWLAWGTLVVLTLVVLVGPLFVTVDPQAQDSVALLPAGTAGHLLGTDDLGRDVLARVLAGGRPFLAVCAAATGASALIGTALGLLAGFRGGWVDAVVMRAMDVLLAFPLVLVAILMVAVLGGGTTNMIVAITISQAPTFARLARNLTVGEVSRDYVRASRCLGHGSWHVALREVLPNVSGQVLVQTTSTLAVTAGLSSALSYLGLGQDASAPDWGYMVRAGQELIFSNPGLALIPALLITVFAVAANFAGDDLRDATDLGRL
jgi:peptide/nickel transport system permease protein